MIRPSIKTLALLAIASFGVTGSPSTVAAQDGDRQAQASPKGSDSVKNADRPSRADRPKSTADRPSRADRSAGADRPQANADRQMKSDQPRRRQRQMPIDVKDPAGFKQTTDETLFSGPQPGEPLPALKVRGVGGKKDGEMYDPVAEAKKGVHVMVFQEGDGVGLRGLLAFSRVFKLITSNTDQPLACTAVFLQDDIEAAEKKARLVLRYLPDTTQLTLSSDGRDGPGAYGLNRNVGMTVLVVKDGKVRYNFAFIQPMLYPDAHVVGAIAKALDVKAETMTAWVNPTPQDVSGGNPDKMKTRPPNVGGPPVLRGRPVETQTNANTAGVGVSVKAKESERRRAALREKLGKLVGSGKLTRQEAAELMEIAFGPAEEKPVRGPRDR